MDNMGWAIDFDATVVDDNEDSDEDGNDTVANPYW